MAFGDTRKNFAGGSDLPKDPWPFMDMGQGKRVFRLLPAMDDSTNPEEEVAALSLWVPVVQAGQARNRRVFIDPDTRSAIAAINPELAKRAQRRFFINVFDRTPVVKVEHYVIYPDPERKYYKGFKDNRTPVDGKPAPNNAIVILEGSLGGEKSLMAEILSLRGDVQDSDGNVLPLTAFDIELTTRGEKLDKVTKAYAGINREPLPQDVLTAPRYDLRSYARPWPKDAVLALLDGADYDETISKYNISVFVKKTGADELF